MKRETLYNLIVTDVFGRTSAIEELASEFSAPTVVLDPYNAKHMGFGNEKEAYEYFIANIGLDNYAEKLVKEIQKNPFNLNLIGFSVGASAIWNISSNIELSNVSRASCFYGSQIRNNVNNCPSFPVRLVFPSSENHFSIPELIADLKGTVGVHIEQTRYLHGFMNKCSINYDKTGYMEYVDLLTNISFGASEK